MPNSNVFLYKKSYKQFHVSSLQGRSVAKNLINKLPKNHLEPFFPKKIKIKQHCHNFWL